MHIGTNAFTLLLLPWAVWATTQTMNVNYVPTSSWMPYNGGEISYSPSSTVQFTVESGNWDTLSIDAFGYKLDRSGQTPSSWEVDLDGATYSFSGTESLPVLLPLTTNHRFSVTIKAAGSSLGLQFMSAVASGPDATSAASVQISSAQQTTTHLQEPPITSSPTASLTATTSGTRSTVTVLATSTIAAPNSQISNASTASMETLGNPYINVPQGSVSLTNPNPSLSTSTENLAATKQPSYSTIVGVVLGVLAAVALCFLAAFLYHRKRQRKRIPPSMAYMNYRSATEQPPRWNLHRDRTAFMDASPVMVGGSNRAGIGAGGGLLAARRVLSPLDERSAEGSMATHSPSPLPAQSNNVATAGIVNDRYPSLDSTIDVGMARTISQPSSAEPTTQAFPQSQTRPVSLANSTAYDGVEPYGGIEITPHSQRSNPFDDARHV